MSRNLLSTVGRSPVDNLHGDNLIFQNRRDVVLGPGDWKRGQALVLSTDGRTGTMPVAGTQIIDAILLDDVGVVSAGQTAVAAISQTGQYNQNSVLFGAIPVGNLPAVLARTRAERQLDISPAHKAPFVQFGERG